MLSRWVVTALRNAWVDLVESKILVIINEVLSSTVVFPSCSACTRQGLCCYLCMQQQPLALGPLMEQEMFLNCFSPEHWRLLSKRSELDSSRKMAQMLSPPFPTLLSSPGVSEDACTKLHPVQMCDDLYIKNELICWAWMECAVCWLSLVWFFNSSVLK